MLRRPAPVPPAFPGPAPRFRLRLLALVAAALLMAGWFAGLTRSGRGWLTIGLAVLVVVLLAVHRRDGGTRWLARVVCEYAAVALLAVLLVLAAGGAPQRHPAHHRPTTAGAAGELCPAVVREAAGGLCDRVEALWRQAKAKARADQASPTTTTRRGR
jgi:hypothetical protein